MDAWDLLNYFIVGTVIWLFISYTVGYATKTSMWWTFFFGLMGTLIAVSMKDSEDDIEDIDEYEEEYTDEYGVRRSRYTLNIKRRNGKENRYISNEEC